MEYKKNLLVTLADENYIKQAKQLFSSVYWNAEWKGDYMLLAHEIPEEKLKWFKERGILVKRCKVIFKNIKGKPVKLSKFYLFTNEFKKWENVVYLDADMIVKASLDELTEIKGFGAVLDDLIVNKLINQLTTPSQMNRKEFDKFKKIYNIKTHAFKSGIMAFKTNIIKKNTFSKLIKLFKKYAVLIKPGNLDQPIFNLLFYKKWEELPIVYNLDFRDFDFIDPNKLNGIVIHSCGENSPWIPNSPFHKEWKFNLNRSDKINLKKIPSSNKKSKKSKIKKYSFYLKIRSISYFPNWKHFIDYQTGLLGIFLYNYFPSLYFKLKKLKK